jgi:hypothetical protein
MKRIGCLLLFAAGAWAQQEEPKIKVNVEGFQYLPVARSASIQGDVSFAVSASGVKMTSGHPLLAYAAQANLQTWDLPPLKGKYLVRYHFVLTDFEPRRQMEPIGNRFDRFFLRLFRVPTARPVVGCPLPETRVRQANTRDGDDYVIDVYVTSEYRCIMTSVSSDRFR